MKHTTQSAEAAVAAACGTEALFSCPACSTQAQMPEGSSVFVCPNSDCGAETCRHCGEEAHVPLKCSEVEKKAETGVRSVFNCLNY
eukprot:11990-Heterococcus_DN1.PRE.2